MDAAVLAGSHVSASTNDAAAATDPVDPNRISTARARAARRGIVLHVMPSDAGRIEFVVTQGGWTRALVSVEELETWLGLVEGKGAR